MESVSLVVYLISLFAVFALAGVYAFGKKSGGENVSQSARIAFWLFVACNALAEYIATFAFHPSVSHDHIYAYSILLHTAFLFVFYGLLMRKPAFYVFMIVIWLSILYTFIRYSHWQPEALISFPEICSYFSIIGVVSLVFLALNLKEYSSYKGTFQLHVAIAISVVYPFLFLITSLLFLHIFFEYTAFFWHLSILLNAVYYSSVAWILFRHIKRARKHHA